MDLDIGRDARKECGVRRCEVEAQVGQNRQAINYLESKGRFETKRHTSHGGLYLDGLPPPRTGWASIQRKLGSFIVRNRSGHKIDAMVTVLSAVTISSSQSRQEARNRIASSFVPYR